MPLFKCPIPSCENWDIDTQDCKFNVIEVIPRSDDWDITIACEHYEQKKNEGEA